LISSKIQTRYQEPEEEDCHILERALTNLDYLWKVASLSYMPKIHSILVHALDQTRRLQGIGDMLEDDVQHIYQMAARIGPKSVEWLTRPCSHSSTLMIEAIQNCKEIKGKMKSPRNFTIKANSLRWKEIRLGLRHSKKLRQSLMLAVLQLSLNLNSTYSFLSILNNSSPLPLNLLLKGDNLTY
jgi:hypothetical protein